MLNCFLIGENHLIIQCVEVLITNGFNVLGIISDFFDAQQFALKKSIPIFRSLKEAESDILKSDISYFFSVVNHTILPKKIIKHIKKFTINYHDAILPKYAGVNATCWAILNNEIRHGITWHVVNETVDAGEILKQAVFPIEGDETALSLNLKCYQYALDSFKQLVKELKDATYVSIAQDLNERSYYGLNKKPVGNGWINWEDCGEQIERYFRASYLGNYINRFCSLKFLLKNTCYIVSKLSLVTEVQSTKPGTIIKISNKGWTVTTKTNAIIVREIFTIDGKPVDLKELVRNFDIKTGYNLNIPSTTDLSFFQKISSDLFSYEQYWEKKLKNRPTTIPFLDSIPLSRLGCTFNLLYSLDVNHQFNQINSNSNFEVFFLTIWSIYLYRLDNTEIISTFLSYPEIRNVASNLYPLIGISIPFDIHLMPEMTFEEAIHSIDLAYSTVKTKKSYLRDLSYRYSLKENEPNIIIVFYNKKESIDFNKVTNYRLLLAIDLEDKEISFYLSSCLKKDSFLIQFIHNIKGHLQKLMESITAEKHLLIKNAPILTNQEKNTLLEKWNDNKTAFPADKTITQVFENQVTLTPTHCALKDNETILTYLELNHMANKMARYLIKKGIKTDTMVILCSFPNVKFIVSMLAILKIGASYIPIDPQVTAYKIETILNDSKASALLISTKCQFISFEGQILTFSIEDCLNLSIKENPHNLELLSSSHAVAHVIYTSGTTGKPKGVLVPHYAVNRLVKDTNYIKITSHDKIALASSISFDASTFEIFGALLNGACLICVSRPLLLNPNRFNTFLEKESITILWLTSELFNQYASINSSMFKNLTYLLVGGDALNPEKIKLVQNCVSGAPKNLINGYGPTENTTFTTTFLISKKSTKRARIPIGKPLSNTTVYVLDKMLNLVPIGVAGTLYTGGRGLAYGYLNKPELTQTKFISNPFSSELNDKLYNTGDVVRWLPDGTLDYLGRKDRQVKIRGLRVELEAVQNQILHYSAVSQCFLKVITDRQKGKLLVAYIVPKEGKEDFINGLKKFLSKLLPNFMIPNHFMLLDNLPLTLNGKVNTRALPPLSIQQPQNKLDIQGTSLEKKLLKIWMDMFSLNNIGIYDDFFNLGGTSLLMTRLLMDLENHFKFHLSLSAFFQEPTIHGLVRLMTSEKQFTNNRLRRIFQDSSIDIKNYLYLLKVSPTEEKGIFLTGATGFLGAHLLHELVQMTQATIYCLVRERNPELKNFINKIWDKYQLELPQDRIILIQGNLACTNLGMKKEDFFDLANKITVIYHNAAQVHHLYSYEQLRESNVLGTLEIIKLASVNKVPLHYVSTLSAVLNFTDSRGMIKEELIQNIDNVMIQDGYSQTKLVSELLLSKAASFGLPIYIYRPAWILGQENTGIVEANNNHLLLLLKGCIQMNAAPDWNIELNIVPVDFVSKLIATVGCSKNNLSGIFNLGNDSYIKWIDLIEILTYHFPNLQVVSEKEWRAKLYTLDEGNAMFELLPIYLHSSQDWVVNLGKICHLTHKNTNTAISKLGSSYPKVDRVLIDKYIHYLLRAGFLDNN